MTQGSNFETSTQRGAHTSRTDAAKTQGQQVAGHAKEEAASVAQDAKREGQHVAETAKAEAQHVADSAGTQARRLMDQARVELDEHAGTQQQRLAGSVRSLAEELDDMVRSSSHSGPANDLAAQAAGKAGEVAGWLESRGPGEVLDDVRRFAGRRPGAFLALAAGLGLVAGRLTRGLTADSGSSGKPPGAPPNYQGMTPPVTTGEAYPSATPAPTPGIGTPGRGTAGLGTPGLGTAGPGTAGPGTPGLGTPGPGTAGPGTPGLGTPGLGTPGPGTAGPGTPGLGGPEGGMAGASGGQPGGPPLGQQSAGYDRLDDDRGPR